MGEGAPVRRQGRFITFEGPDGSGKSTQARWLVEALRARGLPVVHTFEPGGTPLGEHLRRLILGPASDLSGSRVPGPARREAGSLAPGPMAEMLLLAADRAQHVEKVIRPALERGEWVVCDRYVDSSLVYQGYRTGLDPDQVRQVNLWATGGLTPDLTILLDPGPDGPLGGWPVPEGPRPPDWIEDRGQAYWKRVREGYLALWQADPARIQRIETSGKDPATVAREIRDVVVSRMVQEERE